jgi:hypothetical protein
MSDEPNDLQRQMEQATGRSDPTGEPLDAETASLRETWRAFGRLLSAAEPAGEMPMVQPAPAPVRHRRAWVVPAAAGLAASLLAAVTIAWMAYGNRDSVEPSTNVASTQSAAPSTEPTVPISPIAPAMKVEEPVAAPQTQWAWDDSLDNQIVLAGKAVLSAGEEWSVLADGANSVQYGIREIEKDVQGSPL